MHLLFQISDITSNYQ